MRLICTSETDTPAKIKLKQPLHPYLKFLSERRGKIVSLAIKEASEMWAELSEEDRRPFIEDYEEALKKYRYERAEIKAQFESIMEEENSNGIKRSTYSGVHLFKSEVSIQGVTAIHHHNAKAIQMWNDMTQEEREAYNERAREIKEDGLDLDKDMKRYPNSGMPQSPYNRFRNQYVSPRLKELHRELKREWEELSDEERTVYMKHYEEEARCYNAQKEEYRSGDTYTRKKRNKKVLKAKIRQIEEDMNKPQLVGGWSPYTLFHVEKKDLLKGQPNISTFVSKMWHAQSDKQRLEYKSRWSKLKAKWKNDVAKWEERNKDNPKMTELKAYQVLLESAKTQIKPKIKPLSK